MSRKLSQILDDAATQLFAPQPIVRLEFVRIFAPLAMLVFLATRVVHPDDFLSAVGFRLPTLSNDLHRVASFAPLSPWGARVVCVLLVATGLATSAGLFARWSAAGFAVLLGYVALFDRTEAFTVSKIVPVIALALALSPAGSRWSVDAWWRRRRDPKHVLPTHVTGGCVRFFQLMLVTFYCSSGIAKSRGDWLGDPYVLWTHLHDSYQTPVSWFFANHFPKFAWTGMQAVTLAYETLAPVWFALAITRPYALVYGIAMHALIGMMFGPLAGFSLLMIALLVGSFAPATLLDPTLVRAGYRR